MALKACGKCKIIKKLVLFHKSKKGKLGRHKYCKECRRCFAVKNAIKIAKRQKLWRENNSELKKKQDKNWRLDNPRKVRLYSANRRARKLLATVKWANKEAIKVFYFNCPKGMHVDHIIPLQGKSVCGLHVENNLQYLTAADNLRKGNRVT